MVEQAVPHIDGPVARLCWQAAPTMERCDRRKGHGGPHTWEMQPIRPPAWMPEADEEGGS